MTNVVAFRTPPKSQFSEAFLAAWEVLPDLARTRSSRKDAYAEWRKVAAEIGEADLLARVRRYVAEDRDIRRDCGPPAFHRWLKWGRWEHWAPSTTAALTHILGREFPDPLLRASFRLKFHDDRARRWLDRCGWEEATRTIVKAGPVKAEWFQGPFRAWAELNDVQGVKFG